MENKKAKDLAKKGCRELTVKCRMLKYDKRRRSRWGGGESGGDGVVVVGRRGGRAARVPVGALMRRSVICRAVPVRLHWSSIKRRDPRHVARNYTHTHTHTHAHTHAHVHTTRPTAEHLPPTRFTSAHARDIIIICTRLERRPRSTTLPTRR